ncbi:hypothetical protein DHEL01_v201366 [Diaporthe helianthi]|uniref:Uncharacterized protein n=1 Tax=Diaporthe helianthi TaxID=158607 RepID=A0A2P5ICM0_DIAHE|nr:hypothetical protein DHEL01_v201366 [Diaporthe helianthi]
MTLSKAVINVPPGADTCGAFVELRRLMDALRPCQRLMMLEARRDAMVDCEGPLHESAGRPAPMGFELLNSQECARIWTLDLGLDTSQAQRLTLWCKNLDKAACKSRVVIEYGAPDRLRTR